MFFSISVLGMLQKTVQRNNKLHALSEITNFVVQSDRFAEISPSFHTLKLNQHS
jgi:hypothetical protein